MCFPSCFTNEKEYTCDLVMCTLTCNKLSHCLYDFDCPSFDKTYKNEKYQYQKFVIKQLKSADGDLSNWNNEDDKNRYRLSETVLDCK